MATKTLDPALILRVARSNGVVLTRNDLREFGDFHRKSVAYFGSKRKVERIANGIPDNLVAPVLFDLWSVTYADDMAAHTRAACVSLTNYRHYIAESVEALLSRKRNKHLVILDPSTGPGDITKFIMDMLAKDFRGVPMTLLLRDLSPGMLGKAQMLEWPRKTRVIPAVADFIAPANPLEERKIFETVDVAILSQTLDVMACTSNKTLCLSAVYSYLRTNGLAIVLGEEPSRFTLDDSIDPFMGLLFKRLFQDSGWGFHRTIDEINAVANGRLRNQHGSWGEDTAIDDSHHAFILLANKIFRESYGGPLSRFFFIDEKGGIRNG